MLRLSVAIGFNAFACFLGRLGRGNYDAMVTVSALIFSNHAAWAVSNSADFSIASNLT